MLSRKNYVAIADALNKTRKEITNDIMSTNPYIPTVDQVIIDILISKATAHIANYFEDDSPSFNRDKFRAAVWK